LKTKIPKLLGVALTLALVVSLLLFTIPVYAQPPTEVNVDWDGAGWVGVNVDTGDAQAGVGTGGDYISGAYSAIDSNNNPYGYNVDSFSATMNAFVENGMIDTGCLRTDSKTSMYGSAGQESWSFVGVDGGTAAMAYRSTTNFAAMRDCSYKFQLPGGHNIIVDAALYEIHRGILDGQGNSGILNASGSGIATLDCMSAEASGNGGIRFGRGCGCYTDASYVATGSGLFDVTGIGASSVTFNGMGVSSGGGTLSFIANWVNSFSISDYSITAN